MQDWVTRLVGAGATALAIAVAVKGFRMPPAAGGAAGSSAAGEADDGGGLLYALGGGSAGDAGGSWMVGDLGDLISPRPRGDAGAGNVMPDGTPVPGLPLDVPRQVRFGVVLITYDNAQPGAAGGHPSSRSRADAKVLADRVAMTAQQDFHAAVQQGDPGSADDVGRVKMGILEPAAEYVLFTLPIDGVAGPLDTPRGYWVVKRLE
jgi:hypothetical protein